MPGGLMIRLIDIVFILLFGFISISEIGQQHSIEPPESTEERAEKEKQNSYIFLGVSHGGNYIIETPNGLILHLKEKQQVERFLDQLAGDLGENIKNTRVQICSDWDAAIKHAIAISKMCDSRGIPKSLLVRKIDRPANSKG